VTVGKERLVGDGHNIGGAQKHPFVLQKNGEKEKTGGERKKEEKLMNRGCPKGIAEGAETQSQKDGG